MRAETTLVSTSGRLSSVASRHTSRHDKRPAEAARRTAPQWACAQYERGSPSTCSEMKFRIMLVEIGATM